MKLPIGDADVRACTGLKEGTRGRLYFNAPYLRAAAGDAVVWRLDRDGVVFRLTGPHIAPPLEIVPLSVPQRQREPLPRRRVGRRLLGRDGVLSARRTQRGMELRLLPGRPPGPPPHHLGAAVATHPHPPPTEVWPGLSKIPATR